MNWLEEMYEGLFLGGDVVSESLKGGLFRSVLVEKMDMGRSGR
ncbi:hypothetical protein [Staphylococcus saprophyticus]|nr:hypothetical protein [Staphylococcus saprophyticus]